MLQTKWYCWCKTTFTLVQSEINLYLIDLKIISLLHLHNQVSKGSILFNLERLPCIIKRTDLTMCISIGHCKIVGKIVESFEFRMQLFIIFLVRMSQVIKQKNVRGPSNIRRLFSYLNKELHLKQGRFFFKFPLEVDFRSPIEDWSKKWLILFASVVLLFQTLISIAKDNKSDDEISCSRKWVFKDYLDALIDQHGPI